MTLTAIHTRDTCTTRVSVERPPDGGRALVSLTTIGAADQPMVRPMLLSSDDSGARVCLVPDGALLLAGDAIAIDIAVGPGAWLELVEPGGTVAYSMDGGRATWDVSIRLATRARLSWAGEPFVVSEGADVVRRTRIQMAWGARLALRETVVFGRHAERAGALEQVTEAHADNGTPILIEHLLLGPDSSALVAGGAKAIGTVLVVGGRIPGDPPDRMDLAAEGTLVRRLASEAHRAVDDAVWAAAVAQVAQAI